MPSFIKCTFFVSTILLGLAIIGIVIFARPSLVFPAPTISWTPNQVAGEVTQGETKTTVVSFTAEEKLSDVSVWIAPELRPYVTATPSSFPSVDEGTLVTLTLTFSAPAAAPLGTLEGTLHLRETKRDEGDDTGETYAKPLPVTVEIVWPRFTDPASGVSFFYPTFGAAGTVASSSVDFGPRGIGTIYYVRFPTQSSPTPATQYLITIISNSQFPSIYDWFVANVDPDQLLVNTGSFQLQQFANGVEALVLVGPIPSAWDRGPVSEIFAMSASKKSVVTITTSDDDTMRRDLGLSSDTIEEAYLQILENINLP